MPFFWYLLQHLLLGLIQFAVQELSQAVIAGGVFILTIGVTFLFSV
ncbi:protein of unknown function [Tenacibaculum sp. 190524A02b]|uniref:Uncharacterized protein n=1 Tax=Tenacibaculum vairaonense TaxID=3137860 RepID=A0ABM9PMR9_9FLAO